jgi:multicomponent Na+:H+ antiporter subunit F
VTEALIHVLAAGAGTALFVAALLVLVRIVRGPTMLDRVIATDVLVAVIVCAVGLEAAVFRHGTTLPVLLTVSLFAFISAVSVARFIVPDDEEAGR